MRANNIISARVCCASISTLAFNLLSTSTYLCKYMLFDYCKYQDSKLNILIMAGSKVIVLTGASRGIGLAIAHYLLKQSHKVVIVARTAEPLHELRRQYPNQVETMSVDLSDFSVCEVFLDTVPKSSLQSYPKRCLGSDGLGLDREGLLMTGDIVDFMN